MALLPVFGQTPSLRILTETGEKASLRNETDTAVITHHVSPA